MLGRPKELLEPTLSNPRLGQDLRYDRQASAPSWAFETSRCARLAVAKWVRGETNRHDLTGVPRPPDGVRRGSPAPDPWRVCRLLQRLADPSGSEPGCSRPSGCSEHRRNHIPPFSRRASSPLLPNLIFGAHSSSPAAGPAQRNYRLL
jgi:hypothetical protein